MNGRGAPERFWAGTIRATRGYPAQNRSAGRGRSVVSHCIDCGAGRGRSVASHCIDCGAGLSRQSLYRLWSGAQSSVTVSTAERGEGVQVTLVPVVIPSISFDNRKSNGPEQRAEQLTRRYPSPSETETAEKVTRFPRGTTTDCCRSVPGRPRVCVRSPRQSATAVRCRTIRVASTVLPERWHRRGSCPRTVDRPAVRRPRSV